MHAHMIVILREILNASRPPSDRFLPFGVLVATNTKTLRTAVVVVVAVVVSHIQRIGCQPEEMKIKSRDASAGPGATQVSATQVDVTQVSVRLASVQ